MYICEICFFTLGCKVNLFETQALSQLAQARGHEIVDKGADAVIVNTWYGKYRCPTIRISARSTKLRRDNPNAVIAACGCFAQTDLSVRATGEIDLICGTRDRAQVIACASRPSADRPYRLHESEDSGFETLPAGIPHGRTRACSRSRTAATISAPTASFRMREGGCALCRSSRRSSRRRGWLTRACTRSC